MPNLKKNGKKRQKCGFSPPQDDRINRSRQKKSQVNVDHGSAIAHQIWPSLVKGCRYRSPQNCQNLPKVVVFGHRKPTQWTHSDEIWHVSVDLGSVLAHQIWPSSVKGGRYGSPQRSKFAQNCGFWPPKSTTRMLAINVSIPNLTVARLELFWSPQLQIQRAQPTEVGVTENKPSFIR